MATAPQRSGQALTFRVGRESFALPAQEVAEVIRRPALTRVPLGPPSLAGVANVRGAVIPVVSLAALLGESGASSDSQRVIVVGKGSPVGLMVDEISALIPSERIGTPAETARFIDVDALLARDFAGRSRRSGAGATAGAAAAAPAAVAEAARQEAFFSFGLAGQEFALPLGSVREVLAFPDGVAVVPRTDEAMLGVIPLRDRLLPIVSLRHLLGLKEADPPRRLVVASIGNAIVGLAVEDLKAIVRAVPDQIDRVPPVLTRGKAEAQIQAICRLEGGTRLVSILSTDHLLRDGLADRLVAEAPEKDQDMDNVSKATGATEQFVIFELGGESYGLPIASIDEVVPLPDALTRLPKAPAFVEGVMNLRGKVMPVIDQRRRFEIAPQQSARRPRVLVVRVGEAHAGFVVDGVSEVRRIAQSDLREPPELTSDGSKVIDRIATPEGEERMILLIDPHELLDRAERDLIAAMQRDAPETA